MYKKMNLLLIAAALLGASACGGLSPSGNSATGGGGGQGEPQPHTVSITGNGMITLTPDLVHISIGVQTENEAAAQAVAENTAKSQGVIDALISFEIAEEDIRTTNFSVYPRQNRPLDGEPTQTTFIVQNIVSVTVRNLDALGEILDAAVKAGANTIHGISFDLKPETRAAAYDQALEAALTDARHQAETVAGVSGVVLVDVQSINVNTIGGIIAPYMGLGGGGRGIEMAEMAADVPVAPGQTDLNVTVYVVYIVELGRSGLPAAE